MSSILAWVVILGAATALSLDAWRLRSGRRPSAFSWFAPDRGSSLTTVAAFTVATAVWHVASDYVADPTILPTPMSVLQALWGMATRQLLADLLITLRRVAIAFVFATLVGGGLGILAGLFPRIGRMVLPVNSALRYLPPSSFIGLTIIWFGVFEGSKLALIFLAVVFYILHMTVDAVRAFPRSLAEAALNLGATDGETFRRVIFPYCLPGLLAVLRVNMGAAWTFVIVAEVVSAQDGIGRLMAVSQRFLATPQLFAILLLVGALGYATDAAFGAVIRLSSPWK